MMVHNHNKNYLAKIDQRDKLEYKNVPLLDDLIGSQKLLFDISYKFSICNKNTELMSQIENL